MDFGSDYVYVYETPDYEYISEEEYDIGMNISDSDEDDDSPIGPTFARSAPPVPPAPRAPPESETLPPIRMFCSSSKSEPVMKKSRRHHWQKMENERCVPPPPMGGGQRVRMGDTNVVSVKLNNLIAPSNMHAGDPTYCSGCGSIMSKISSLLTEGEDKVWKCEFCNTRNIVDVEAEEIPKDEDVTFMLEPALATTASGPSGMDESLIVFCVDTSGSMCVTTEVPGHVELRGAETLRRMQRFNRERADQHLPRQRRDVTYISRLQSVQAAIDHQLQQMEKEFPNRRVAIVTFSDEVSIIGDGHADPLTLAGDKLGNKEELRTLAEGQPFPASIKTSRSKLGEKLFKLEECGTTALGPALLVATTMAAKVRGSKVILCTDGMANVGMGKLDNFKTETEEEEALKFYEEVANSASEKGVSISVITIKGTDCKLVELGKLADTTGGQVNIVDPKKLTQEFSTILANQIIATNVVATFVLHKQLFFFYEDTEDSKVVKNIGNATADTEITFEYGVRTKSAGTEGEKAEGQKAVQKQEGDKGEQGNAGPKADKIDKADSKEETGDSDKPGPSGMGASSGAPEGAGPSKTSSDTPNELPFQLQIVYTDTEGAKALRLITRVKPVTRDRKKAEKLAKIDVLAAHTAQAVSEMALEGQYTLSRQRALVNQRVAWRHHNMSEDGSSMKRSREGYKKKFGKIKKMENYLNVRQKEERRTTGRTYSDDEDEGVMNDMATPAKPKSKGFLSKLRKKRSETTEDKGAALVYKGKSAKNFFEESDEDSD